MSAQKTKTELIAEVKKLQKEIRALKKTKNNTEQTQESEELELFSQGGFEGLFIHQKGIIGLSKPFFS